MKKALLVVALATVLALSFSTVAMAKYAGYQYLNGADHPGYLSWQGANTLAARQGGDNGSTPHGGYAVNTTKCAVCHSAHRAASDAAANGIGSYWKLTPGALSCVACHTPSGSNPVSTALVEWPAVYADGGPHNSFHCLGACHGTVHGANASEWGSVAAFNLTNRNDAAIGAAFAAGNVSDGHTSGSNGGSATYGVIDANNFDYTGSSTDLANKRAMATGYTCNGSGCHTSSMFAVNTNGYAELRASNPAASSTMDLAVTGHLVNMGGGCGPCHVSSDSKCAACHDAKGKATNSSAFPHANRNIVMLETNAAGASVDTTVTSGNLWMLAGDVTFRDALGNVSSTGTASPERRVVEGAVGGSGNIGNINDGVCLKCHGYKYWPTHGMSEALDPYVSGHANSANLNFSTK